MPNSDVVTELAAAVGQTLPATYIAFLDNFPLRPTLGEEFSPILEFAGRQWRPYSREELAAAVRYNRGSTHARAHETTAVAEQLRAGDAKHNGEMSAVLVARGFTLSRLAHGFCVGDNGNGEPLFVDADSGAVYAYYHDGMDCEKWAESLDDLISGSRDWTGDEEVAANVT
jgi:hypothetical protein